MSNDFVEYLNRVICIEDIVVLAYASIYNDFSATKINKYRPENHKEIQEYISMYFELKTYNSSAINLLKENLKNLNFKKVFSFEDYYCIIETIDSNYEYTPCVPTSNFNTFKVYSSLSKIYDEPYVFLIPKVKKSYTSIFNDTLIKEEKHLGNKKTGFREKKPYDRNNINAYLNNLSLLHMNDILNRKLIVHEYNKNYYNNFYQKILDKKTIEIVTVPLTNKKIQDILEIEEDEQNFWINGMIEEHEAMILDTYLSIIKLYNDSNVDFIIFPEMFLTENILKQIQEHLKVNDNNKMQIYILGTIWSGFSNKVIVMTSDGEYIFSQYKTVPFDTPSHKAEKLIQKETPYKIHLIDFPDLARVNTFICREIEDDALMTIPKKLESNIVFTPTFSASLDMKTCPMHLASNYHCLTIISNACSARYNLDVVKKHKAIGFICQPCKKDTESSYKIIDYNFNEHCINCKDKCTGFKISIKFGELDSTNDKTYCTKIEKK